VHGYRAVFGVLCSSDHAGGHGGHRLDNSSTSSDSTGKSRCLNANPISCSFLSSLPIDRRLALFAGQTKCLPRGGFCFLGHSLKTHRTTKTTNSFTSRTWNLNISVGPQNRHLSSNCSYTLDTCQRCAPKTHLSLNTSLETTRPICNQYATQQYPRRIVHSLTPLHFGHQSWTEPVSSERTSIYAK
jgi:hypothetical protein